MKKFVFLFVVSIAMIAMPTVSTMAAGSSDEWGGFALKPALSLGYLQNLGNTGYGLTAHDSGLGGVTERKYDFDAYPAIYVEGKIPFMIGKRLEVALSGSWAIPAKSSEVKHNDFDPPGVELGGRTWDSKTNWLTANLQVSYAVVKDFSFIKSVAPVIGIRYDYGKTSYDRPHDVAAGFAAAASTDTAEFTSSALLQYFGITAAFGDFKIGKFGGELKISAIGGWTPWGEVKHEEYRNGSGSSRLDIFKGRLDSGSYFVEIGAEYTMFSFAIAQRMEGSISVFTKYNLLHTKGELDGVRTGSTYAIDMFDFKMDRSSIAAGITGAIKF